MALPAASSVPSIPTAPPATTSIAAEADPAPAVSDKPTGRTCHGAIDEALQHELAGRGAQVRWCYQSLLERDPKREGRLMVTVEISGAGTIDDARITLDELGDPETSKCALGFFERPLHGAVRGDCVVVNVPLRFTIQKPKSPEDDATQN